MKFIPWDGCNENGRSDGDTYLGYLIFMIVNTAVYHRLMAMMGIV